MEQIFNEKIEFEGQTKIEAHNPGYKPGGGNAHIFNEKVEFDAPPKVDHVNTDYKKPVVNVKVSTLIESLIKNL